LSKITLLSQEKLKKVKWEPITKGMNRKMAKCPKCGKETSALNPIKEWDLSPKVHVKLYEHCGRKFREYIRK